MRQVEGKRAQHERRVRGTGGGDGKDGERGGVVCVCVRGSSRGGVLRARKHRMLCRRASACDSLHSIDKNEEPHECGMTGLAFGLEVLRNCREVSP